MNTEKEMIANKDRTGMASGKKSGWNWWLLPLQFVLLVLPFVLQLHRAKSGYSAYAWNSLDDSYADVFLHGKMIVFTIVGAITFLLLIMKLVKMEKEQRKKSLLCFIPLFVYLGFVILSTICSKDSFCSLKGAMDAKEPFGVLAGYVIIAFYAYIVINDLQDVVQLATAAVIGSAFMAIIGILQTIGMDPLATESVQRLFAGNAYIDTYGPLQLTFPKGQAYGTLFNPNYVGTYVAMYTPFLLIGVMMYKQWWKKAFCGASLLGLLITLFASQSRTGLIAIAAVVVLLVIFFGRELWKRWYLVIPAGVVLLVAFFAVDSFRGHLLTNRLKEMFAIQAMQVDVHGVDTTKNGVRVLYKDTEFTVKMAVSGVDYAYVVLEGEEQKDITYENDYAYFTLSNGDEIAIRTAVFENCYAFGLVINGRNFYFTNQVVIGNYKYINEMNRLDECVIPDNVFPGYEAVASARGYVWGRTIPLLLQNLIVGSGPDTFAIEFPQNDYVARYLIGYDNVIFTRPHNFYLQMGVQTGVISLLAFLVFYLVYFVGCCRRYFNEKFTRMEQWFGFGLFLSTVGFMVAGLANDSLVVVTPMFYVFLGAGMVINHKFCPVTSGKRTGNNVDAVEETAVEETKIEETTGSTEAAKTESAVKQQLIDYKVQENSNTDIEIEKER